MKYSYISVDFDGTICDSNYPDCGEIIPLAKEVLTAYHKQGGKIIINTCREGKELETALQWLKDNDIPFNIANAHLPEQIELFKTMFPDVEVVDSRKLYADLYIDDKDAWSQMLGRVAWEMVEALIVEVE